MKIDWCRILGHKWIPVYITGYFGHEKVKFIATECKRCRKGDNDLIKTIAKMSNCPVNSYSEKHYLTEAVDSLPIYRTPEKILEFIEKEIIIKNPPYDVRKNTK